MPADVYLSAPIQFDLAAISQLYGLALPHLRDKVFIAVRRILPGHTCGQGKQYKREYLAAFAGLAGRWRAG
ncbi:hypothetical protein PAGU2196_25140 [Pseudomonas sp. PAGU 2196]|nr:hypothetical protein PAGU2196_25140 [Pseudomonas sp. PAGU 2196]